METTCSPTAGGGYVRHVGLSESADRCAGRDHEIAVERTLGEVRADSLPGLHPVSDTG